MVGLSQSVSSSQFEGEAYGLSGNSDKNRRWRKPHLWLLLSVASCVGGFVIWCWGVFSGGLDAQETCEILRGQVYDDGYREEHWREPSRVFPLHNKCNASYDLVAAWINPTLVCLAVTAVGCLIAAAVLAAARFRLRGQRNTMT